MVKIAEEIAPIVEEEPDLERMEELEPEPVAVIAPVEVEVEVEVEAEIE